MLFFLVLFILSGSLPPVIAVMTFINPAPQVLGEQFSDNLIYPEGTVVNVAWTQGEAGKPTSLTLWQLNATTGIFFGKAEYITQSSINTSRFSWIVATTKNLSVSNLFYLSIFEEGKSNADSNSKYFNITRAGTDASTTSATSSAAASSSATTPSSPTDSSSTTPAAGVGTPTISTPAQASPAGGLSTGAQIGVGLGVSIPCAIALSVVASWFFFARRRKRDNRDLNYVESITPTRTSDGSTLVSMTAQHPPMYPQYQKPPIGFSDYSKDAPSFYELYAPSRGGA
ncbi:hypothetical protein QBC34DRAFT_417216 [Podospora aff. communis PSN243]|uniref:Mid2 domain-containing protein n=1 Tax=Podospora aff. communis PSN243 TaxID=3040156 RepID=A0AAV9G5J4_9PEZI|nr:hypothetical protein QBC34DRAFT_417216 [Podospora aff. communis PSN243]